MFKYHRMRRIGSAAVRTNAFLDIIACQYIEQKMLQKKKKEEKRKKRSIITWKMRKTADEIVRAMISMDVLLCSI